MNRSKNASGSTPIPTCALGSRPPPAAPVGDRHAAGERSGEFDVDRRRPRLDQAGIQGDRRRQRIVQVRQIALALVEVKLEVEPHRILERADQPLSAVDRVPPRESSTLIAVLTVSAATARRLRIFGVS